MKHRKRHAEWAIAAVFILCPYCEEYIENAKGSQMLGPEDIKPDTKKLICKCGKTVYIAASIAKRMHT